MRPFEICVVLVRTLYDSNIGASSRAMSNMGAERLILIEPKCEITFKAQQAAASGQSALQNRTVYSSWEEFHLHEGSGIRISFTARDGKGRQALDYQETLQNIRDELPLVQEKNEEPFPLYLIFGPEDWGLSSKDLELSHFACSIPTFGANTSLNLAQAVLLALFITRSAWGGQRSKLEGQQTKKSSNENVAFPERALKTWIEEMGFDLSNPKTNAYTVLRRMLLRTVPNAKESNILEIVLNQGIRKLREYNQLRREKNLPAMNPLKKDEDS